MYRDNAGNEFDSYEAACIYYGVDTPAQLEAEDRYFAAEEAIYYQDAMEARGGPIVSNIDNRWELDDDIPF